MTRKKIIIVCLISVILSILGGYFLIGKKNKLVKYQEELLNINFDKYVENAIGEVITNEMKVDFARVRFEIKNNKKNEFLKVIQDNFCEISDIENYINLGKNDDLLNEMRNNNVLHIFSTFMSGEYQMTRHIVIYITEDESGNMYVYIFG